MSPPGLPPNVPLSKAGRAAQDLGVAFMLGGNLFARFAMHPAVTGISDERERGKLVNAAWRRYGTVNSLSLAAVVGGWVGARLDEARPERLSPVERRLALAKDVAVAAVTVTGVASGLQGMRFAKLEPGGAVPLRDGDHASENATEEERRAKARVQRLGTASLVSQAALIVANAALAQENFRRPPARRLIPRIGRV